MELSAATLSTLAGEYDEAQPLSAVEEEHRELLPKTLAGGDYGWRDLEWVVQWYYRRFLGTYPDAERRAAEAAFRENGYAAVRDAVDGALAAEGPMAKLDLFTELTGVDVPVASAFLQFIQPDSYVVTGPREWRALREAGELSEPYPDAPSAGDYERYLAACRSLAERADCDLWTVYRALWMVAMDEGDDGG